ncbi:MAG: YjbF family lipoprotein [Pseudomonadota bacterium]
MTRSTKSMLAALALLLAACGSDPAEAPLLGALAVVAKTAVAPRATPAPAAAASVTRQQVTDAAVPLIRVRIPSRSIESFITRRDSNSGTETWFTNDGTTFTLRNGVLISTRALQPDLMSAATPTVAQLSRAGGSHQRAYFILGDNDGMQRLSFDCTVASQGSVRLTVIERVYATTHMQETCTGDAGKIVNDYWIERGSTIRQSRQWTNPTVEYTEIAKLTD